MPARSGTGLPARSGAGIQCLLVVVLAYPNSEKRLINDTLDPLCRERKRTGSPRGWLLQSTNV